MAERNLSNERSLKNTIARWLTATRSVDVSLGMPADVARTRASELLTEILYGSVAPADIRMTDEFRDVLSALVGQLAELDREPSDVLSAANTLYRFIACLEWPATWLAEQQDLLRECAEIGWRAIGLDPALPDAFAVDADISISEAFLENEAESRSMRECNAQDNCETESQPAATVPAWERLSQLCDSMPAAASDQATTLYRSIADALIVDTSVGVRVTQLGQLAAMAGRANRLLGRRAEAELWLTRAEVAFRQTADSAHMMSNLAYERMGIQFDIGDYARVLELLPLVRQEFEVLGMRSEVSKCSVVQAMTLKAQANFEEAAKLLQTLRNDPVVVREPALLGHALVNLADIWSAEGKHTEALGLCAEALPLLRLSRKPYVIAHMKGVVGDCLWHQGRSAAAISAHREAIEDYEALGMRSWVAYHRVILAERLITTNRCSEAENELIAALPTIEEQKMVPEGFAAVALLKESVRRRKTDPNALRELREHLQASK